jgi:fructose-specific phosphotransferase system IIC component
MKKLAFLIIGALVVYGIDQLIGIKFEGINRWVVIIHRVVYILWGAIIAKIVDNQ